MQRRLRNIEARVLPRGWADVLRQLSLFLGAYLLYQVVRGLVDGNDVAKATWNAYKVISLERTLHVFVEPGIQAWVIHKQWLMDIADSTYLNAHYVVTIGGAGLDLPAAQRLLLLRAQHVHGGDGVRARRLRAVPDGAAAADARSGASRIRSSSSRASPWSTGRPAPCSTSTPPFPPCTSASR